MTGVPEILLKPFENALFPLANPLFVMYNIG